MQARKGRGKMAEKVEGKTDGERVRKIFTLLTCLLFGYNLLV